MALLLTVAGITTVICKRLKQPLVLGYVIAGFIVGIALGWFPGMGDTSELSVWAEIGVIFLMFGLGLEFSFVKLSKVGKSAIVTALVEMGFMILVGFVCGTALGWNTMDAVFLGGMLAISSTTIIIKAFDELGLKGQRFTQLVFGTLIIEDIIGVFLMVLLSTVAVSSGVEGGQIAAQIGQMGLYLLIWFIGSIVLVPTILKRVTGFLNDEIILVVSVALCLLMVVLADSIGFSAALGAFIAGSVLAGTVQAHRIETLVKPVKDLFGAVFFISVGMLVSPAMLATHLVPIIVIALVTLLFKPLFTFIGALLSKAPLKDSVQSGLSLSQIGEFSFIIAALGMSLGVTSDFLYPIIVSVSVITTLTTPLYIKHAEKIYGLVKKTPLGRMKRASEAKQAEPPPSAASSHWKKYLKNQAINTLMVGIAAIGVASIGVQIITYVNVGPDQPALRIVLTVFGTLIVGLFIANLQISRNNSTFAYLWINERKNRTLLVALSAVALVISFVAVGGVIRSLSTLDEFWITLVAFVVTALFSRLSLARSLNTLLLKLKALFVSNLNEQSLQESLLNRDCEARQRWVEENLSVVSVEVLPAKPLSASEPASTRPSDSNPIPPSVPVSLSPSASFATLASPPTVPPPSEDEESTDSIPSSSVAFLSLAHLFKLKIIRHKTDEADIAMPDIAELRQGKVGMPARKSRKAVDQSDRYFEVNAGDVFDFIGNEHDSLALLEKFEQQEYRDAYSCRLISLRDYLERDLEVRKNPLVCATTTIESDSGLKGRSLNRSRIIEDFRCMVVAVERNALPVLSPEASFVFEKNDTVWVLGRIHDMDKLVEEGLLKFQDDCPIPAQILPMSFGMG